MLSSLIDELLTKSKSAPNESAACAYREAADSLKAEILSEAVSANYVALERWVLSAISSLENSNDKSEELLGRRLRSSFEQGLGGRSPSSADALLQENEALLAKVKQIQASAWEGFDPDSPTYPRELDIAMQAWRSVSMLRESTGKKPRPQLKNGSMTSTERR